MFLRLLDKTKILNFPIATLAIGFLVCLWVGSIKLGAAILVVLCVLAVIRFTGIVLRNARYTYVKNRHSDNLFNLIKRWLKG